MKFRNLPAWPFVVAGLILAAICIALLAGCGSPPVRSGSAQADAEQKQARAASLQHDADQAAKAAAEADARAMLDEAAAKIAPTADLIAKAGQSRADAIVADAIAKAEAKTAKTADDAAQTATAKGDAERLVEAKAADARSFATWCRWIGLGGVVFGILVGGAIAYLTRDPRAAVAAGGLVAAAGIAALTFGAIAPWLPWLVVAAAVASLAIWAWKHNALGIEAAAKADLADGLQDTHDALAPLLSLIRNAVDRLPSEVKATVQQSHVLAAIDRVTTPKA